MTQKLVSQLDGSGFFVALTVADESPLEPGVWLMPARTVSALPPGHENAQGVFVPSWEDGKWPLWNGSAFVLVDRQEIESGPSPTEKLRLFLSQNPDVAALVIGS